LEKADLLIEKINRVIDDAIPLFLSDEIPHYRNSLLKTYGIDEEPTREHAKRGRPKKPIRLPHPDLNCIQVVKHRKKGRVTPLRHPSSLVIKTEIARCLSASPVSRGINISFVECNNLIMRQSSNRLARKTNGFSKDLAKLEAIWIWHLDITTLLRSI
jgi:hypothetical protein